MNMELPPLISREHENRRHRHVRRTGLEPTRRAVIAAGSLALLSGCSLLGGTGASTHAGRRLRTVADTMPLNFEPASGLDAVNRERKKRLLPAMHIDARLQEAAQRHADRMAATGLYGHEIGPGTDFQSRIYEVGFTNSSGENIGVGYGSVDDAIQGWLDSPPHRKNMLKANYNAAGIAYAFNTSGKNPRYTHFWVLIMGKG
jgi:uncharacterized protein YkwD